jgi:hypothetical protein
MIDLGVDNIDVILDKLLHEHLRLPASGPDEQAAARLDSLYGLGGGTKFAFV